MLVAFMVDELKPGGSPSSIRVSDGHDIPTRLLSPSD
jgi:hypothetical protein